MLWRYFCHHLDVAIRDPGLLDSYLGERLVNAYYVSYFRRWCAISIWLKLQSFHSNNCGKMFCNTIYKNIHFNLSDNLHQLYHQFTLSILTEMMHSIATLTVNGMVKRQRHWVYCREGGKREEMEEETACRKKDVPVWWWWASGRRLLRPVGEEESKIMQYEVMQRSGYHAR